MARVFISRAILTRIARQDGLRKNLKSFIEACQNDKKPPRIYKRSGIADDGSEYFPYTDLNLHHHHLHNNGDPLLITQHVDDSIYGIGVSTHAEFFDGDKMKWLKEHAHMIDWSSAEWLEKKVSEYEPDC